MQKLTRCILAIAWTGVAFSAGHLLASGDAPQVALKTVPRIELTASDEIMRWAALSQANQEITRLEALNRSLARQIELLNLPLAPSITHEQLLGRIDSLPASVVSNLLAYLIDEEYLAAIEDPNQFAKDLVDVALDNDEVEDVSGNVSIEFSFSPIYGLRQFSYASDLQQFDRIFAHLSTTQDMPSSMIRWQHQATGEILLFKQQALRADAQSQMVSLRPSQGWQTGNYKVSVYDMDDDKRLVGTNEFSVASIQADESGSTRNQPDMDIIQDLIAIGEAVPKSY
jgi:hypothetical protein